MVRKINVTRQLFLVNWSLEIFYMLLHPFFCLFVFSTPQTRCSLWDCGVIKGELRCHGQNFTTRALAIAIIFDSSSLDSRYTARGQVQIKCIFVLTWDSSLLSPELCLLEKQRGMAHHSSAIVMSHANFCHCFQALMENFGPPLGFIIRCTVTRSGR